MPEHVGSLCIVLHAHLPYVLNHGTYPHGEAWLYEAAAESWLPLLDLIGDVALHGARPAVTIGLTPVLLEQLAHETFKRGFMRYLRERSERAAANRREFERENRPQLAGLAAWWERWFEQRLEDFERIGGDIPGQFAARAREGHIQLLASAATHAYLPLLLKDQSISAQFSLGGLTTEKHLGAAPRGFWLPECAYRPASDLWQPAALHNAPRYRPGLEGFMARAGVSHFFVESHLISNAHALGVAENGSLRSIPEAERQRDCKRGWYSPLEPVGIVSQRQLPEVYALARHPSVAEQVWSSLIGYPGAGEYLDFHRKHGERGLRYWRITDKSGAGEKAPYDPDAVAGRAYEQALHFCDTVRDVLAQHHRLTGRQGTCVAAFDAELFGHWWFEGPRFLRDVLLNAHHMPDVQLATAEEALQRSPRDKVMRLPEGSWGRRGDHSVWLNDRTRWMWAVEYRAEERLEKLLQRLPWRSQAPVKAMLARAARQLLLLQASDWPFVLESGGAVDYGIQRFSGHAANFDRATLMAEELAAGEVLSPLRQVEMSEMDAHDTIFPQIDLNWWM